MEKKAQITVPIHIEPGNRQHQGRGREAGCHGYGYLSCGLDGWDICSKLRDVCKGTGDDPAGYGPGRHKLIDCHMMVMNPHNYIER